MQETVFFLILSAILLALLSFSLLVMLANEYKRWIKFMEEQREYFRISKIRRLRELDREREIQRRRMEHMDSLKRSVSMLAEAHKQTAKPGDKKNSHTRPATPAKA